MVCLRIEVLVNRIFLGCCILLLLSQFSLFLFALVGQDLAFGLGRLELLYDFLFSLISTLCTFFNFILVKTEFSRTLHSLTSLFTQALIAALVFLRQLRQLPFFFFIFLYIEQISDLRGHGLRQRFELLLDVLELVPIHTEDMLLVLCRGYVCCIQLVCLGGWTNPAALFGYWASFPKLRV